MGLLTKLLARRSALYYARMRRKSRMFHIAKDTQGIYQIERENFLAQSQSEVNKCYDEYTDDLKLQELINRMTP
jgi:hypothetical protein